MGQIIDTSKSFVHVYAVRPDGLVEFSFAVGERDLSVDLAMPQAAFDDFCRQNAVEFVEDSDVHSTGDRADDWSWSLREATQQRFR